MWNNSFISCTPFCRVGQRTAVFSLLPFLSSSLESGFPTWNPVARWVLQDRDGQAGNFQGSTHGINTCVGRSEGRRMGPSELYGPGARGPGLHPSIRHHSMWLLPSPYVASGNASLFGERQASLRGLMVLLLTSHSPQVGKAAPSGPPHTKASTTPLVCGI